MSKSKTNTGKPFTIIREKNGNQYATEYASVEEAVKKFSYTLEVGRSWEHEKGNKKINRFPKTKASLIKNINNAVNNAAANGYSSTRYYLK